MVEKQNEESEDELPSPDGGWGWFCVLACFLTHVIIGGMGAAGGVLFLELKTRYGQPSSATAWVYSLRSCLLLVCGPLASALSRRFSYRSVVMAGGVICVLAMLLSAFTPNMAFLYFSYGVVAGFGSSLAYAPGLVMVGLYFSKRRGLAVGLSTSGAGVGAFLVPPMLEILFEYYGFTGAFILLGGLVVHLCLCGSLYRPLALHHKIQRIHSKRQDCMTGGTTVGLMEPEEGTNSVERKNSVDREICKQMEVTEYPTERKITDQNYQEVTSANKTEQEDDQLLQLKSFNEIEIEKQDSSQKKRPLWRRILGYLELSLLKNVRFLFFCLSICIFSSSFKTAYVYIPPLVKSRGISELDAAYIVSTAGISDLFGRIILSTLFDTKMFKPHRELLYVLVLGTTSAVVFTMTYIRTFIGFAILSGLFGFLAGGFVSQKSIIIVDILGREKLSSSFGIVLLFQGIGILFGPPIAGFLADVFGSFEKPFFWCGSMLVLSGATLLIGHFFKIYFRKRNKQDSTSLPDNKT